MPSDWLGGTGWAEAGRYLRSMNRSTILRTAAVVGFAAVAVGAFGAHGLRGLVSPESVETFEIGIRYAFYHALALGLAAALYGSAGFRTDRLSLAAWLWLGGIVLFSGSLTLLTLRDRVELPMGFLGPITPIGGLFLLAGWVCLFFSTVRTPR